MIDETLLQSVEQYYSDKVRTHGAVARGVDWKDEHSQWLRFDQLLKIRQDNAPFSINDYGCGLGCLVDRLEKEDQPFTYHGVDVSAQMVATASQKHAAKPGVFFSQNASELSLADYTVASGVFNVRLQNETAQWKAYVEQVLHQLDSLSLKGFACNFLTTYSDADKQRADLFYADPAEYFAFCKNHFSRNVALLHDYGLYEFTLLVRKDT